MIAEKVRFFEKMDEQELALTYDDVRLRTTSRSEGPLPEILDISSRFSEHVELKVPFVSAAMDKVTTADMAIAMAKMGGIGVIHAAMPIKRQMEEVRRVKLAINGLIHKPISVLETDTLEQVQQMCATERYAFRTFPVRNSEGQFVGILTGDDFKYAETLSESVAASMRPAEGVMTASTKTSLPEAYRQMQKRKVNTLPLLQEDGTVGGMYLWSDVSRIHRDRSGYNVDANGQFRTSAAVSTGKDVLERIEALQKYLDVVVVDTADGDSSYVFQTLKAIKDSFPDLDVVVGNVSEGASAYELAEAGANGIKVGQGPGSICTTRRETGIGMPQVTAVYECVNALSKKYPHIPVIADGGIKEHGDIPIAFAAGAHAVMMGRVLAGTAESPGEIITRPNKAQVKVYRGMGSASALFDNEASKERYGVDTSKIFLAEGVEAFVPYEGPLEDVLGLCILALRKSMRYVKAPDLTHLREKTLLRRITNAGLVESSTHDVEVINQ